MVLSCGSEDPSLDVSSLLLELQQPAKVRLKLPLHPAPLKLSLPLPLLQREPPDVQDLSSRSLDSHRKDQLKFMLITRLRHKQSMTTKHPPFEPGTKVSDSPACRIGEKSSQPQWPTLQESSIGWMTQPNHWLIALVQDAAEDGSFRSIHFVSDHSIPTSCGVGRTPAGRVVTPA